jgi:hypothetical protein
MQAAEHTVLHFDEVALATFALLMAQRELLASIAWVHRMWALPALTALAPS